MMTTVGLHANKACGYLCSIVCKNEPSNYYIPQYVSVNESVVADMRVCCMGVVLALGGLWHRFNLVHQDSNKWRILLSSRPYTMWRESKKRASPPSRDVILPSQPIEDDKIVLSSWHSGAWHPRTWWRGQRNNIKIDRSLYLLLLTIELALCGAIVYFVPCKFQYLTFWYYKVL